MRQIIRGRWYAAIVLLGSAASAGITVETVPVGNPGNAADSTGYGSVGYVYNIGKYEVTTGQYTAFLNAVAAADSHALYNTNMSDSTFGNGISRGGEPESYKYSVDPSFANRPVNYVSFWDACRFTNWLHNGQPTGPQDASTTEDGAYTLTPTNVSFNRVVRNESATWAVTSENEWYKAAYYDAAGSSYYQYPTGGNTAPGQDLADVSGNNANYYTAPFAYPIDSGKFTTVAGEFQHSDSPNGTFDQAGNVREWNETRFGFYRGQRGGSYHASEQNEDYLRSSMRFLIDTATAEYISTGFRVSQVPEPASMLLPALGGMRMLVRRRG